MVLSGIVTASVCYMVDGPVWEIDKNAPGQPQVIAVSCLMWNASDSEGLANRVDGPGLHSQQGGWPRAAGWMAPGCR